MANQTTGLTATVSPAPIITDIADAVGPFPGTIPTRGQTYDTHPTVSGVGVAGDTITLYQNGVVCGQTTVAADGTWSVMITGGLSVGAHDITATQTASGQSESAASNHWPISILASTQSIPVMNVPTDDSGAPITGTTADTHPIFSGTGTAGDLITVYDAGTPIASVTVKGDGTWSVKPSADLSSGTHDIYAVETNSAGTPSVPSNHASIVIDTTPPPPVGAPAAPVIVDVMASTGQFPGTVPPRGITDDTHPTISGTGIPGYTVSVFQNGSGCGQTTVAADGTWSIKVPGALSGGVHDMTATQSAPGTGESLVSNHWSISIAVNAPATPAAPTLSDDSGAAIAAGSTTADAHPHINGNGTAGDIIKVLDNGTVIGSTTVKPDGTWSFTPSPDLNSGAHDITVTETNPAGMASLPSNPTHITIDTSVPAKPPVPVLTDDSGALIPAGSTTNDGHPHISGTGKAGDIITVYDGATALGSVKIGSDGKWTFTPSSDVSTGAHSISVTDTNAAGTTGPKSDAIAFNFSLVAGAPVITSVVDAVGSITGPIVSGGVTDDNHPTVSGTGVAGYTIYIFQNGAGCGQTTVDATGHWSLKLTGALSDGLHVMTATQFIGSNPPSASSNAWNITVDTSVPKTPAAPTLTDDSGAAIAAGSTTADAHPHINGNGTAGDIIKVLDNGTVIGSTTVKPDGTWSFTPSPDMSSGAHDITTTETNAAGTPSLPSNPTHITIDTSVPAKPPVPVLTDDSGALIPAGSTTNDGHPHISGTGKAGDIITVYDGATALGSVKIGSDGKWVFTPSSDVSTGAHSISVTDTNAAGTTGPKSDAIAFTFSLVAGAPVITSIVDAVGTITGPIVSGGVTDDNHPTISGTGVPGYTVWIYQNGDGCGATTVDATGHWSLKLTGALSEGLHVMTATQFINSNLPSPSSNAWNITVDTSVPKTPAAPTLTDDSGAAIAAGGTTADAHPHINGNGTAGDIIKVLDNGTVIGSTTVKPDGTWSFTPSPDMSSGAHDITTTETNAAGTPSLPSNPTHITIDTSVPAKPPVPVLTDDSGALIPAGSTTNDGHPHISGTGKAGDIITVYDGATALGSVKIGSDGKWTFTPSSDVSTGAHSISVTDTNAAGTTGPKSDAIAFNFALVAGAPVITSIVDAVGTITGPIVNGGVTDDNHPTVSGTGVAGNTIYIFQNGISCGQTTVDSTGHWTLRLTGALSDGAHAMTATQFIGSNPQSPVSNSWTITVDTSVPAKPVLSLTDDSGVAIASGSTTTDGHPYISGTGRAGDIVKVYDSATLLGSVVVDGTGHWTFKPSSDLSTGMHSLSATETNAVGTVSAPSDPYPIYYMPMSAPSAPVITGLTDVVGPFAGNVPSGGTSSDVQPIVQGTGHAGDKITVYDGSTVLGTTTVRGDGTWSFKPSTALSSGTHSLSANETNAGGTSPYSAPYSVYIDTSYANAKIVITGVYDVYGHLIPPDGTVYGNFTIKGWVSEMPASGFAIFGFNGDRLAQSVVTGNTFSLDMTLSLWKATTASSFTGSIQIDAEFTSSDGTTYSTNRYTWNDTTTAGKSYRITEAGALYNSVMLSATHDGDATVVAATNSTTDQSSSDSQAAHHTVVGEHDAFKGTTGHDTVDLNADPTSYFKETTAHIEGSTVHPTDTTTGMPVAVNTLHLTGDHQVLDLTSLTGQTAAAKISGIEAVDLGGQHNTLKLSLVDVLNLGEADLFMKDGKQQMMVQGKAGDEVDLSNSHIAGVADGQWEAHGTAQVGGVTYNVYEHSGAHTELLVQQGVQIVVH